MKEKTWKFDTQCDACNKEFILFYQDIQEAVIDSIKVKYFKCKHCNQVYITECIDDFITKERLKYQKLRNKQDKDECMKRMLEHGSKLKEQVIGRL